MYKKTFILVIGLFFPFIFQSDDFVTFGQGDTSQQNLDLNGIWERNDDDGYEDSIYVTQTGDKVIGSEDTWSCWENPYNRVEGTSYAPHRLAFIGKLIGNTVTGQTVWCYIEERTMKMVDMNLVVSNEGKTLNIFSLGTPGDQFRFVSRLPVNILINMVTSKPAYDFNEQVEVKGQINNLAKVVNNLFLEVYGPDGKRAFYDENVPVNPDGTFLSSFNFNGGANNGTYTAHATYATASKEVDFEYGVPIGVISVPVAASGIGIAAGGLLLYKLGIIDRVIHSVRNAGKNGQSSNLPVVYVGIECGLENTELPKKETLYGIEASEINRLEQTFSKAVDDILKNRKAIKKVQDDIEFTKWCKEAKENPKKILSKVSDDIINKFLSSFSPYFGNLIMSEISVESDVSATRDKHKKIRKSVQFNLVPIEPYIEFVLYVNTQWVSSAKFIFTIETNVEVKNLTINMTATDSNVEEELQERPEQNYDKKISVESLIFAIIVEFSRLKIGPLEKNITPPVIIGTKKVEIKKFGCSHR